MDIDIDFKLCYRSMTMIYQKDTVQGFLYKDLSKKSLFSSRVQRYFVLDHEHNSFRIHKNNKAVNDYHKFAYSDIQDVKCPAVTRNEKASVQERFSFQFELVTRLRTFYLYAASVDERWMWVHTFKWIVMMQE